MDAFIWNGAEAVLNQHIFRVQSNIDRRFHYYLAKHVLSDLRRRAHGSGMVHITKQRFEETPVLIPTDAAEQRGLVATIEEQLTRVDSARRSLQDANWQIQRFRSAMLERLFRVPAERLAIGEFAEVFVGSTPARSRAEYWGGNIPWVSSGEVRFDRIRSTRESITAEGQAASRTRLHPPGTVLLAMIGEGRTRGQSAILDIAACTNQNAAAIRVDQGRVLPEWLQYFLLARYEHTRLIGSGNNQPALNKAKVQSIEVPVPDVDTQRQALGEIEQGLSVLEEISREINVGERRAAALSAAIVGAAMTGGLKATERHE